MKRFSSIMGIVLMLCAMCGVARMQGASLLYYVSVTGSDSNDGLSEATAFRTVDYVWNSIPQGEELTQGYTITILPGTYTAADLPNYWESRYGTDAFPIHFMAQGGLNTVYLPSINLYGSRYITFENLNIELTEGDPFHCEKCDHVTLTGNVFKGANPDTYATQETVKFNQSQYIELTGNDISGAWDNAIDFVSVQYSHILGNKIHNAGDWCAYTKGGSAYIRVENNNFYDCGTGGYTAGQGTGFQFMTPPWTQYEAYAIQFTQNVVHDTQGAGVGIQGGYDIVIEGNIFYKVGERSHVIEVGYGLRTCDGEAGDEGRERCVQYRDAGGWGNDVVDDGTLSVRIPNKNVYIIGNIVDNPAPYHSGYQQFSIFEPYEGVSQEASNLGRVVADENLHISDNIIWNGDATMPLGIEAGDFTAGCQSDNPTCNMTQILADNLINTLEPQFKNAAHGDFSLVNAAEIHAVFSSELPVLPAWDVAVPAPDLDYFPYYVGP